mgnify:CR=1 FL=1
MGGLIFLLEQILRLLRGRKSWMCPSCQERFGSDSNMRQDSSGQCCWCASFGAPLTPKQEGGMKALADMPPANFKSPQVHRFDDWLNRAIVITIPFDETTYALKNVTVYRDPECLFSKVLIGVGDDGVPDNTDKAFAVPVGTTIVTTAQLAAKGLSTFLDVRQYQITAGR